MNHASQQNQSYPILTYAQKFIHFMKINVDIIYVYIYICMLTYFSFSLDLYIHIYIFVFFLLIINPKQGHFSFTLKYYQLQRMYLWLPSEFYEHSIYTGSPSPTSKKIPDSHVKHFLHKCIFLDFASLMLNRLPCFLPLKRSSCDEKIK